EPKIAKAVLVTTLNPEGRTTILGRLQPRAATPYPAIRLRRPWWSPLRVLVVQQVVLAIPVFAPFPHVAVHVVQPEGVCGKLADRGCERVPVIPGLRPRCG